MQSETSRHLSLRWKMLLGVVTLITLGFGITLYTLTEQSAAQQRALAIDYAQSLARQTSAEIAASTVQPANESARALAASLSRLHAEGVLSRAMADELVIATLLGNRQFIGVSTAWEPDAFDGNDRAFVNAPRHDATGRYIPYFVRDAAGRAAGEALVDYETPGAGDYYIVPRRTGRPLLAEPFTYPIDGEDVLMSSVLIPIMEQGRFLGLTGVDMALSSLQEVVEGLKVFDSGYATLVSNGAIILGDRDVGLIGQDARTIDLDERAKRAVSAGDSLTVSTRDKRLGGAAVTRVVMPLDTGFDEAPWSVILTIPESEMLAGINHVRKLCVLLGLISIAVVSLGLYLLLERLIIKPLGGEPGAAVRATRLVARGDLSQPIPVANGDRTSVMAHLKLMQSSLAGLVGSVRQGAQEVAVTSTAIASGNQDLASRTNDQAEAVQATSESMHHVLGLVKHNTTSATEANSAVSRASAIAVQGGQSMARVIDTMQGIGASSNQIVDIIEVIDTIAFQTNILALNAAVEAARAGEQGRGFAVVASEVRSLAGRSSAAAKQIRQLIDENVQRVAKGTEHVDAAGSNMTEVVEAIETLNKAMQTITDVSTRQNADVTKIGDAVQQFHSTTHDNKQLVHNMSASVTGLQTQADGLVESVSLFRL